MGGGGGAQHARVCGGVWVRGRACAGAGACRAPRTVQLRRKDGGCRDAEATRDGDGSARAALRKGGEPARARIHRHNILSDVGAVGDARRELCNTIDEIGGGVLRRRLAAPRHRHRSQRTEPRRAHEFPPGRTGLVGARADGEFATVDVEDVEALQPRGAGDDEQVARQVGVGAEELRPRRDEHQGEEAHAPAPARQAGREEAHANHWEADTRSVARADVTCVAHVILS